uniref:Rhodanese domain-containing protein n=1 Tax=Physcomitrium patens TaxID=3218 RepID=A0A7I4E5J8_PHYPA
MTAAMVSGAVAAASSSQLLGGCSQEGGRVAQEISQMARFGSQSRGFQAVAMRRGTDTRHASSPALVKDGRVKSMSPKEAGFAVKSGEYTFLDVRPSNERAKASVKNSTWIPMYDVNKHGDPGTLYKKVQNLAMGGWWSGQALMKYNERFMPDVVATIPKSAKVVVACQKGLRSLAACEQMYKVGYRNLYWLNGGLDAVDEGDLEREGPQPFKLAGIGGMSEFLGWTDVQRTEAANLGFGYRAMLFGRVVMLMLAVDMFFFGSQQLAQFFAYLRQ